MNDNTVSVVALSSASLLLGMLVTVTAPTPEAAELEKQRIEYEMDRLAALRLGLARCVEDNTK